VLGFEGWCSTLICGFASRHEVPTLIAMHQHMLLLLLLLMVLLLPGAEVAQAEGGV
jgi:hypothetical protein